MYTLYHVTVVACDSDSWYLRRTGVDRTHRRVHGRHQKPIPLIPGSRRMGVFGLVRPPFENGSCENGVYEYMYVQYIILLYINMFQVWQAWVNMYSLLP